MIALLERVIQKQTERKKSQSADWWQLVRDVGDGKDNISPELVERVLSETGKTIDNFRSAVTKYQARKAMTDQIATAAEGESERPAIEARAEKLNAELNAAKVQHEEAMTPLRWRIQQINEASAHASIVAGQLSRECPYDELHEAMRDAQKRSTDAGQQSSVIASKLDTVRGTISTLESRISRNDSNAPAYREELKTAKDRLATYLREKQAMTTLMEQCGREMEQIQNRMMEP